MARTEYIDQVQLHSRWNCQQLRDIAQQTGVKDIKQKQVKRVALFYISKNNLVNTQFRFDVIGITLNQRTGEYQLDHIPNAFA